MSLLYLAIPGGGGDGGGARGGSLKLFPSTSLDAPLSTDMR